MINEKKLEEAAEKYVEFSSVEDEYPRTETSAFKEGAYWAVDQFLKDLWHNASEEPELNKEVLVDWRTENRGIMYLQTKLKNWKKLSGQEIKRWLYIDDLLSAKNGDKNERV